LFFFVPATNPLRGLDSQDFFFTLLAFQVLIGGFNCIELGKLVACNTLYIGPTFFPGLIDARVYSSSHSVERHEIE
jgi:hypothetical protein